MKLYLAPMEALTGYIFRNVYNRYFGDADRYFTPFIASRKLNSKEKNDVLPEHNQNMDVIPQILTNKSEEFCYIASRLKEYYGYEEVNLNLGCPSGTVVAKNRGSGFLAVPDELNRFFEEVFSRTDVRISVKTRTGVENNENWENILKIYNDYPISELIIHPRCRKDGYGGKPNLEDFKKAVLISCHSLCYNGDINSVEDYNAITKKFPTVDKIMCGRGILMNPGLFSEIKGGRKASPETLYNFANDLYKGYKEIMSGDRNVLFKLKEFWIYFSKNFEEPDKVLKMVRKADTCIQYEVAVGRIFGI